MQEATAISFGGLRLTTTGRSYPQGLPPFPGRNSRLHPQPRAPSQGQYLVRVSILAPFSGSALGFGSPEGATATASPAPPWASSRPSGPPPCSGLLLPFPAPHPCTGQALQAVSSLVPPQHRLSAGRDKQSGSHSSSSSDWWDSSSKPLLRANCGGRSPTHGIAQNSNS